MASPAPNPQIIRFAAYEVDLRTGELRKHGLRIRLQDQPFQILAMLLERPGELVTREQIRERLWPVDTFVDFDHSLNTAIRRLRDALSDSADNPRFVETLPRRGYRFIAEVQQPTPAAAPAVVIPISSGTEPPPAQAASMPAAPEIRALWWPRMWVRIAIGAALVLALGLMATLMVRNWREGAIDSVAVLPFTNAGHDPSLEYLSEGIAEGVIDSLSELPQLKVASRNSAFRYRQQPVNAREIGRTLSVSSLVIGSVRRNGDDLHLSVELVDTRDDRHLWGKEYDLKVSEIGTVQQGMLAEISQNLRQRLTAELKARIAHRQSASAVAYLEYLRGQYALHQRENRALLRALEHFQKAIDADPNYALAYSGMSSAYGLLAFYGGMSPAEALPLEKAAVERALQLDPLLADAHMNRAYLLSAYHRDQAGAEREMRRAIELNPRSADAHHGLSMLLSIAGRWQEGVAESRRAQQLDPLWPGYISTRAWLLYYARRYDEALQAISEVENPFAPTHWARGLIYVGMGRYDEAVAAFDRADPSGALQRCQKAWAYAASGRPDPARKLLADLLTQRQTSYISGYNIAAIYAALHEPAAMMQWLRAAEREFDPWLPRLGVDPAFDKFRSLPEFVELQRRITTPRY